MTSDKKVLLLDLDGTVRYPIKGIFSGLNNQRVYPQAKQLIEQARMDDYAIVAVSNQGGIDKGFKSLEGAFAEFEQLNQEGLFDWIIFCPNFRESGQSAHYLDCTNLVWAKETHGGYRKPNPGMLYLGCRLAHSHPARALMVGNRPEDKEAALLAAINFIDAVRWRKSSLLERYPE